MATATLAEVASRNNPAPQNAPSPVKVSMDTVSGFEAMQRIANLFASSTLVPKQCQGNIANCFIAVYMAQRMGANPLLVIQNLYIVQGNPARSAQFLIVTFNKSGRFSAIRYEFVSERGKDNWGCRASATKLFTGEKAGRAANYD